MDKLTEAIYDSAFITMQNSYGNEEFWEWFRVDFYDPEGDDKGPYLHYHQEDYPGDEFCIYREDLEEGIREGTIQLHTIVPIDISL